MFGSGRNRDPCHYGVRIESTSLHLKLIELLEIILRNKLNALVIITNLYKLSQDFILKHRAHRWRWMDSEQRVERCELLSSLKAQKEQSAYANGKV